MAYLSASEAGADILDTAFSPFAGGASQPPVESIVGALRGTKFDTKLDLEAIVDISNYFRDLRERFRDHFNIDPRSETIDATVLIHQIPGGMISNLISQLKEQNALTKLDAVLKEIPRVRKDLGYPPLVTPTSQIVGTQAVMNVLSGRRYATILKEVKDYLKGLYGEHPGQVHLRLQKRALGQEKMMRCRPADLIPCELEKTRRESGSLVRTEEDLVTYALFPHTAPIFLREKVRAGEEIGREHIVALAVALAKECSEESEVRQRLFEPKSSSRPTWKLAGLLDLHRSRMRLAGVTY
jgi:pyruvate carboxylase subunit B